MFRTCLRLTLLAHLIHPWCFFGYYYSYLKVVLLYPIFKLVHLSILDSGWKALSWWVIQRNPLENSTFSPVFAACLSFGLIFLFINHFICFYLTGTAQSNIVTSLQLIVQSALRRLWLGFSAAQISWLTELIDVMHVEFIANANSPLELPAWL